MSFASSAFVKTLYWMINYSTSCWQFVRFINFFSKFGEVRTGDCLAILACNFLLLDFGFKIEFLHYFFHNFPELDFFLEENQKQADCFPVTWSEVTEFPWVTNSKAKSGIRLRQRLSPWWRLTAHFFVDQKFIETLFISSQYLQTLFVKNIYNSTL